MPTTQCSGTTKQGKRCTYKVKGTYCRYHQPKDVSPPAPVKEPPPPAKEVVPPKKKEAKEAKKKLKEKVKEAVKKFVSDKEDCAVCIDPVDKPLFCGHWVHMNCVVRSGKDECPVCRGKIPMNEKDSALTRRYNQKYTQDTIQENGEALREMIRRGQISLNVPVIYRLLSMIQSL